MGLLAKISAITAGAFLALFLILTLIPASFDGQPHAVLAFNMANLQDAAHKKKTKNLDLLIEDSDIPAPLLTSQLFNGKKPIILIIAGLGLDDDITSKTIIDLPLEVTLSFSPYADHLSDWQKRLKTAERPYWIELPLQGQSSDHIDNGPFALKSTNSFNENLSILNKITSDTKAIAGLLSIHHHGFFNNREACRGLVNKLNKDHIRLVHNAKGLCGLTQKSTLKQEQFHPAIDRVIDIRKNSNHINNNLRELEQLANKNGMAIGLAHPSPLSLGLIKNWYKLLPKDKFQLVPLSRTIKTKEFGRVGSSRGF